MYFRYYGKIIFKTIIWAVILVGLIITMAWFMVWCISNALPQLQLGLLVKLISFIVAVGVITKFHDFFLRYPFQKTFTARRIIDAPVEVVWEQVRPRARNKPYNVLQSSIRKVGDEVYRYYDANSKGSGKTSFDMRVTHSVPYQVLEMEYADEDSPNDFVKTSRGIVYKFRSIGEDQTEIAVSEVHQNPSLFTFYVFEFMGAHRDDFRQLASACENEMNISWASAQVAMEELASHPDAELRDVLRPIGDGAVIALTAFVTTVTMIAVWIT